MTDTPAPNTTLIFPPAQKRSFGELFVLTLLAGMGLGVLFLLYRTQDTDPTRSIAPRPPSAIVSGIQASPVVVEVHTVIEFATATPWPTAYPTQAPSPTPDTIWCDQGVSQAGDVCTIMYPPLPTTTPYPRCDNTLLTGGDKCVWTEAMPTATPTTEVKEMFS